MSDKSKCLICGTGYLTEKITHELITYKGQEFNAPIHYSTCNICGDQANAAQTRKNKRTVIAFKKQVDGLLSGAEIRKIRIDLNLNQLDAAARFGGGPVAFSKYENDDIMQSKAMDHHLRSAIEAVRHETKSWQQINENELNKAVSATTAKLLFLVCKQPTTQSTLCWSHL